MVSATSFTQAVDLSVLDDVTINLSGANKVQVKDGGVSYTKLASDAKGRWIKYGTVNNAVSATTFDFNSLPNHKRWLAVIRIQPDPTNNLTGYVYLKINNDGGANYRHETIYTGTESYIAGDTGIKLGYNYDTDANIGTDGEIIISNGQGSANVDRTHITGSTNGSVVLLGGIWLSNATITRLTFYTTDGGKMYGKVTLYYDIDAD